MSERTLPRGATGWASYPTKRVEVPDGWRFEVMPLTYGRGRITVTDGSFITDFW